MNRPTEKPYPRVHIFLKEQSGDKGSCLDRRIGYEALQVCLVMPRLQQIIT
jgi:hypothetical protein